jgi:hypothetical protein
MGETFKKARFEFTGDKSTAISDEQGGENDVPEDRRGYVVAAAKAIGAYLRAAATLLAGKMAHLKPHAPEHLIGPTTALVVSCPEGTVVRYEAGAGSTKIIAGWVEDSLRETVACFSQRLLRLRSAEEPISESPEDGVTLTLSKMSGETKLSTTLCELRVCFDQIQLERTTPPRPGRKPWCLGSVRNTLEIGFVGELLSEDSQANGQRFVSKANLRLPVGWNCIEVYPSATTAEWDAESAPQWAETDLYAAVVSSQIREEAERSLDPNAAARQRFANLLKEFRQLLDSAPEREEILQVFLRGTRPADHVT